MGGSWKRECLGSWEVVPGKLHWAEMGSQRVASHYWEQWGVRVAQQLAVLQPKTEEEKKFFPFLCVPLIPNEKNVYLATQMLDASLENPFRP